MDDDTGMLEMMTNVLSAFTVAEVVGYTSPVAAIEALKQEPLGFDLVISDFNMPELNGAEMCDAMRDIAPGLKTILVTGNTQLTEAFAEANGFDTLVHKPFRLAQLLKAIEMTQFHHTNARHTPLTLEAA